MYEIGTATDHLDLLAKLDTFLTTNGSAFGLAYAGTGNGVLSAYRGGASSVAETFTITATSATNFTVVGSVSGSIGPATAGTPFSHAKIAFTITAGGTAFIAGDVFTLTTAPKWIQKMGPPTASVTRWRVNVLNTVGGNSSWPVRMGRVEMFVTPGGADQVTGGTASASSNTGGHAAADAADTDNSTYWESTTQAGWWEYLFGSAKAIKEIAITYPTGQFTDNYGPKDFDVEYWNGSSWVVAASFRNETSWTSAERRVFRLANYVWQAPGNDGVSQIFVGAAAFQNAGASWYNWRLDGFTAFDANASWFSQPGSISVVDPFGPILPLSNSSTGYWFVVNGRRVLIQTKCSSVYGSAYLGLLQPYASPGQWPLPLFVGGALWFEDEPVFTSTLWQVGTAHSKHTCYPLSFIPLMTSTSDIPKSSSARLRKPDGSWLGFVGRSDTYDIKDDARTPASLWPYAYGFLNQKADLDGSYPLYPILLLERVPDNIYGQFDGVSAVPGTGLSAEAAITIGIQNWVAFPDATRSSGGDFFAVRLD